MFHFLANIFENDLIQGPAITLASADIPWIVLGSKLSKPVSGLLFNTFSFLLKAFLVVNLFKSSSDNSFRSMYSVTYS
jgi:hypothetical protein